MRRGGAGDHRPGTVGWKEKKKAAIADAMGPPASSSGAHMPSASSTSPSTAFAAPLTGTRRAPYRCPCRCRHRHATPQSGAGILRRTDQKTGSSTRMAGWEKCRPGRHCGISAGQRISAGSRDIGIAKHDGRRMTAQFHGDPLHCEARPNGQAQLLADSGRSGECHLAKSRGCGDEIVRNLGGNTEHQV